MPRVPGGLWRLGVLGLLAGPVFVLGLNVAVAEVGATVAGFLTGLYAVFAASMAPAILREPLERSVLGGLVMALVGTAMLTSIGIADADMYGTGAGLVASLGYAFYLVLGRKWSGPYRLRPDLIALAAAALTGVAFLTWLLHTDPGVIWPESPRTDSLVALGWLALVMIGGQTLVMVSARRSATRRSAAFLLLNPITAAALGVLLLDEVLSTGQVVGAAFVLTGMALASGVGNLRSRGSRGSRDARESSG